MAFGSPQDLTGAVISWELENVGRGPGPVLVKAYVHTSGITLKWGDGGEYALAPGETRELQIYPDVPAWQETGYDPTKAEVIGVTFKAHSDAVDPTTATAPVVIRGMRIEPAQ
jgi:hypothetical protein